MMTLCFFASLITVAIASRVNEDGQVNKRFVRGFPGGNGDGFLIESLGEEDDEFIRDIFSRSEVDKIDTYLGSLFADLEAAASEDEFYAVFEKRPLGELCPFCWDLKKNTHIHYCVVYCQEKDYEVPDSQGD